MIDFREQPEFQFGTWGEDIFARILCRMGWFVNMTSHFSAHDGGESAPVLLGPDGRRLTMPDVDQARAGIRKWAEVKTKTAPSYSRITRTWDHGLSRKAAHQYQHVQDQTGTEVWIYIMELMFGAVLRSPLAEWITESRVYEGDKMGRGGMLFRPRCDLEIFGHWQGEAKARGDFLPADGIGDATPMSNLHLWPGTLPVLGPRVIAAYTPCQDCLDAPTRDIDVIRWQSRLMTVPKPIGTWAHYGGRPLCLRHAKQRATSA
jgi:hypothetical protein